MPNPIVASTDIAAIVGGYHGDPFRVLGPHSTEGEAEHTWEIRAFLPHASEAYILFEDEEPLALSKHHPQGFFAACLEGEIRPYRLKLKLWAGGAAVIEDAYRFPPLLTSFDLHIHGEGTQYESYKTMGAHVATCEDVKGVRFAVWAPNAQIVSVVGDFNEWDARRNPMRARDGGVWELFLPGVGTGAHYKYFVRSKYHGYQQHKSDPYGFQSEVPPKTASIVTDLSTYQWNDKEWLDRRARMDALKAPMAVYEVHLESWMRRPGGEPLTYRELADKLIQYVKTMGYTHIELLPIMEHPYSGSWGYQVVGYYAPTARFGTPEDFMYFVDCCHQEGIGVILDWVPAHFPKDAHGLAYFDGTALYEHADPRRGEHKEWGTLIFNFSRNEVRTFLISNAMFWLTQYHIDGLRVDAVASMLYLDYSRKTGEWVPNQYGGNENLEAIDFLRRFNELAHQVPGVVTIAEESTSFPGVSKPAYLQGLGFTMKWNMGWMHDMLHYFAQDPIYRKFSHQDITFSLLYAFSENFLLPISHDEVVYGKRSLLRKMPGDEWRAFANARVFLAYMYGHPGKKLLFMGCEIGQTNEWNHATNIDWQLLEHPVHRNFQAFARELNHFYVAHPALWEVDFNWKGFEWVDFRDFENSVISFIRRGAEPSEMLLFVCNFTPVPRLKYRIGVPKAGRYIEVFNTDSAEFGGSNVGNAGFADATDEACHGRPHSIVITLPPLGVLVFQPEP